MNLAPVLFYSVFFNQPLPDDRLQFLRAYPTDYILLKLSQANAIIFKENSIAKQKSIILSEMIFAGTSTDSGNLNYLRTRVEMTESVVFAPASISLLIKSCLESYIDLNDDQLIYPNQLAEDLLRTVMIFNQIYFGRIADHDPETFDGTFMLEIMQQNYLRSSIYQKFSTMLKYAFLSKYLTTDEHLKPQTHEFCSHYSLGTPWQFGKYFMDLFGSLLEDGPGKHFLNTIGIPKNLISDFTLDKEMIRDKEGVSFTMDIVPKPLYRLPGGHVVILDFSYFQYAIDQGIFFTFYQHTSLQSAGKFKKYNDFQGYIAFEYFEKYLVDKHLRAIFHRKHQIVISNEQYQDFVIKVGSNKVLVIEVKMVALHAKTIESMDFESFTSFIDKNFLSSKSDGAKDKGVAQILKQLNYLAADKSGLKERLGVKRADSLTVYPIIIYSDANLDISGVNEYVNQKFTEQISEIRSNFGSVRPVLMININIFLNYFSLLKTDATTLTALGDGYFKQIRNLKKKYQSEKNPFNFLMFNKSFTTYLDSKVKEDQLDANLREVGKSFDLDILDFGMEPQK